MPKVVWLTETLFSVGDEVFECQPPPSDSGREHVERVLNALDGVEVAGFTLYRTDNPEWDEFGDPL